MDGTDLPLITSDLRACPEAAPLRLFALLVNIVLMGWSASDFAQAQQANSCKQCSFQRRACTGLFRKNLPGRVRAVHEKLPAQITGQSPSYSH